MEKCPATSLDRVDLFLKEKPLIIFIRIQIKQKNLQRERGIDNMVVSFGSVHGIYIENPVMDLKRLRKIREKLPGFPLVMHGGSGLSREDTKKMY